MSSDTYDFSLSALERALDDRFAAIVAIDAFGRPADIGAIQTLALPQGCVVVEDACQAYGGRAGSAALGDETVNIAYRTTRADTDGLVEKLVRMERATRPAPV